MSEITSINEYWNGHTKVEVEDYIKQQLNIAVVGGAAIYCPTPVIDVSGSGNPLTSRKISINVPGITTPSDNMLVLLFDLSAFAGNTARKLFTGIGSTTTTLYYYAISLDGGNTYYPYVVSSSGFGVEGFNSKGDTFNGSHAPLHYLVFYSAGFSFPGSLAGGDDYSDEFNKIYTNGVGTNVTGCFNIDYFYKG